MNKFFTSESVTEGHPDKVCDQISDAILTEYLKHDNNAKVALECFITKDYLVIGGEVKSTHSVDYTKIAKETLKSIGYDSKEKGFDYNDCTINVLVHDQSLEINESVTNKDNLGAGDQGIMFGFANKETTNYMPLAITLAHDLAYKLSYVRKNNILDYLLPDGKTQVTVEYDENNVALRVDTVLISTQHKAGISNEQIHEDILKKVILEVIDNTLIDSNTKFIINPSGAFTIGGPLSDAGLTGRKIIVDTYGGYVAHGGGAFSGKDYTKVDRSASYMARYIAKNIVASNIADKCEIQLSYAIGLEQPISVYINTFNTSKVKEEIIINIIRENFDLSPKGIKETLSLDSVNYLSTATYGHFNDNSYPWEQINKIDIFKGL
ncbi:MAG: methionine adenosyltransferase [Mycoplasmatales bacterium]